MGDDITKKEILKRLDDARYESEDSDVLHKLHKLRRAVAKDVEVKE